MSATVKGAIIGAIATLLVGAATIASTIKIERKKLEFEREQRNRAEQKVKQYRRMYEKAVTAYTDELGRLIGSPPPTLEARGRGGKGGGPGPSTPETASDIVVRAKAIVAVRGDFRSPLSTLVNLLDSQIDRLQAELTRPTPDPKVLLETLRVLDKEWPAKKKLIDAAAGMIMAEMGIVPNPEETGTGHTESIDLRGVWKWEGEGLVNVHQKGNEVEATFLQAPTFPAGHFCFRPGDLVFTGPVHEREIKSEMHVFECSVASPVRSEWFADTPITASEDGGSLQGVFVHRFLTNSGNAPAQRISFRLRRIAQRQR